VLLDEEPLYRKEAAIGDVEVGFAHAYLTWLAVFKQGKLLDVYDAHGKVLERDGALHVLSASEWYNEDTNTPGAGWNALVVHADGTVQEAALSVDPQAVPTYWMQVSTFHDKAYTALGVRGVSPWPAGQEQGYEVTWRWDKAEKLYTPKVRKIPKPPAPKRR